MREPHIRKSYTCNVQIAVQAFTKIITFTESNSWDQKHQNHAAFL